MIAIFDLDDTMLDLETPLTGAFPALRQMKDPERYRNRAKILETIAQNKMLENLTPFPKALELVERLREKDVEIVFITARGWYPNAEKITRDNLNEHGVYFDELIVCDLEDNKGDFLNSADRYILSLEDNPNNHMKFKEGGVENPYCIYTSAFDYSNINPEELVRCHSEIRI